MKCLSATDVSVRGLAVKRSAVKNVCAAAFALMAFVAQPCYARGVGKLVTKETQKEMELDFELTATREPNAVIVGMEIRTTGKLERLHQVRLIVPAADGHFLVRVPMEMEQPRDGLTRVWAQIAPELAEKASIELVTDVHPRGEYYFSVRLAEYITDRKAR